MHGGIALTEAIKSISAVKPPRPSGAQQRKKRRGGFNIRWKRITAAFDEHLKQLGADPAMAAPLSRWAVYGHITVAQAMAGRRYASVVVKFERYCLPAASRTARSANLQPMRAEDQEIEQRINNGTLPEYEANAAFAKKQYRRVMKVLDKFADPITGRNFAKDALDQLCLQETEPPAAFRAQIAAVLSQVATIFGIKERR